MKIQGSDGISEPAPHVPFLPVCFGNTTVSPIKNIRRLIFEAVDYLVSITSIPCFILSSQQNGIYERAKPANGDVHEHNPMAETIPRCVPFTVLNAVGQSPHRICEPNVHTTLAVTAPFRFPLG